jgi:hypothetical protein
MTDLSKTLQTTRDKRVHSIDRGGGVHLALEYRRDIIAHSTSRIIVANNPALSGKVSIPPVRHDYQIHRQRNLGKESIEVQLDPTGGVFGLKSELQARTGVPMERMKVMAKSKGLWKGVLKDTVDLIQMLMMGSMTLPVEPVRKTVFLEDLAPEEAARMVEPSNLVNLGNTCSLKSINSSASSPSCARG